MAKVSVIMPTYNRALFLKEAIKSVLLQDFKEFEIIVTDNASTDNTREVVQSFEDQRIVYFANEKNIGVVNNYNKGLQLAKGEYIYIFSDDDIMLQSNILKKVHILDKYKDVGLVHSNIRMINELGQITIDSHWAGSYYEKWFESHRSNTLFDGEDYFKILYSHWNIISMPSVMVRKSVLDKIGAFDVKTHYFCDWDLWFRICLNANVYYLSEKLLDYRIHGSNTISEVNEDIKKRELVSIKEALFEKFPEKMHFIGLLKDGIPQSVFSQIKKYPLLLENSNDERMSLLRKVKNKMIRLIS